MGEPAAGLDPALLPAYQDEFAKESRTHVFRDVAAPVVLACALCALSITAAAVGRLLGTAVEDVPEWLRVIGGVAVVVAMIATKSFVHREFAARCPYCRCSVDDLGRFCPVCGEGTLTIGRRAECGSCSTVSSWTRFRKTPSREYRVHHCSACGLSICPKGFE